ncbi:hypothetical protein P7C70_g3002, partial [Phenoliferia sp. Uapishka_3]
MSSTQSPLSAPNISPTAYRKQHSSNTQSSAYDRVQHSDDPPILLLPLSERSYGDGGLIGIEDGDLGGGGLREERRDKGKGREKETSREEEDEETPPGSPFGEEDDENESKRIADNLAQWSATEKARRQSLRRSATIIYPNAPVSASTITNLSRRGSALFRSTSTSIARPVVDTLPILGGVGGGGGGSEESNLKSRRQSRRNSVRLEEIGGSPTGGGSNPFKNGAIMEDREEEEEGEGDDASPPPGSPAPPDHPAFPSSVFIEHLPAQSPSPTKSAFSSPPTSGSFDVASPISPISSPPTSPDTLFGQPSQHARYPSNPFTTVLLPLSNSPPLPNSRRSIPYPLLTRASTDSIHSIDSNATERPVFAREGMSRDSLKGLIPPKKMKMGVEGRWRSGEEEEEDEDELEEKDGGLGILDWLLCGCWRVGDGEEGQRGRTNPNE